MDRFYIVILSILILPISVIFYLKWIQSAGRNRPPPPPPGPRGLPIVGYLPFLGENLLHDLKGLEEKYGPIYKLRFGHTPYTVISSPSLAREVLRDHDAVFAHRRGVTPVAVSVATFGGADIAWSAPGPEWRAMRKIFVQEMMSSRNFEESYQLRREEVRRTIRHLHAEMAGKPVDLREVSSAAELRVLMNLSWGGTVAGEAGERVAAEVNDVMTKIMELIGKTNVSDYYPFLARFDLQGIKKRMEVQMESLDKILDALIALRREKKSSGDGDGDGMKRERMDFLEILLTLTESGDAEISRKQLKAMLMDVIGGGSDTSATVEWAMAELMNNPKAMSTAQKELHDVVGSDRIVEEFHIPKLKYLEGVIKETLRLHPPVPLLIPRSPNQASTIGGFAIPKDSGLFVNIWSIQRNPTYWDAPLEFKPERFLDTSRDFGNNQHYYLPFGSGRRICAGRALAEKMVLYLVASLVHSFNWSVPNGGEVDMAETYGLVLRKSTPLIAIPNPRLPNSTFYM